MSECVYTWNVCVCVCVWISIHVHVQLYVVNNCLETAKPCQRGNYQLQGSIVSYNRPSHVAQIVLLNSNAYAHVIWHLHLYNITGSYICAMYLCFISKRTRTVKPHCTCKYRQCTCKFNYHWSFMCVCVSLCTCTLCTVWCTTSHTKKINTLTTVQS